MFVCSTLLCPQSAIIPTVEQFNLYSFRFDDFNLSDDQTLMASVAMFKQLDLINTFKIDFKVITVMYIIGCCYGDIATDFVFMVDYSKEKLSSSCLS